MHRLLQILRVAALLLLPQVLLAQSLPGTEAAPAWLYALLQAAPN